jgi:hypothetical protein
MASKPTKITTKITYIDYDPDEEAENKKLSDDVNKLFSSYITSLDKSNYTKGPKFDGKNIDFMFEIIKHYVGFLYATIFQIATSMKIPVKLLDENIATVVHLLKRRGIFLTPVASSDEDKITPKLFIQNGEAFIKDLLEKTMKNAPSIEAELNAKKDEVIRHLEEEKRSFAKATANANAAAAALLASEGNSRGKPPKKQKKKPGAGAGAPNAAANLARMAKEVARNAEAKAAAEAARNAEAKAAAEAARNAEAKAGAGSEAPGSGPAAVPAIQKTIHWMMSQIHATVYGNETIQYFLKRGFTPEEVGTPANLTNNIARLYFHGGNSVSWYTKERTSEYAIPYESDFDMICLINPDLKYFAQIRKYFFELIISTTKKIMDTPEWKENIKKYYAPDRFAETIQFNLRDYKGEKSEDDAILFDATFIDTISKIKFEPSPLNIQIIPNIVYREANSLKQLGVASIKMTTSMFRYGVKPIELFEITCPSKKYEHIWKLWEVMDLTLANIDGYGFYVPKPVSLYLEQRIALEGTPDSLPDKKARRFTRSKNMKNLIRRKYNSGNANIRFELNTVVGDYDEPFHSYINEIKA